MAKGNLLLGTSSGKLGDIVNYRMNGQQMSRVYVATIKNPKTTAQMRQRAIMATVTNAYSALSFVCDHSWEGVQYGGKSMYKFLKVNANLLRPKVLAADTDTAQTDIALISPNTNVIIPNTYIISSGSLECPLAIIDGTSYGVGNFAAKLTGSTSTASTMEDLFEAFGLTGDDMQLTFVGIELDEDSPLYTYDSNEGGIVYDASVKYQKITRNDTELEDDDASATPTAALIQKYLDFEGADIMSPANIETWLEIGVIQLASYAAIGVIYSKYEDEEWKRSDSRMVVTSASTDQGALVGLQAISAVNAWLGVNATDSDYLLNDSDDE